MTNWAAVAEPRVDGSDTAEILDLVTALGGSIPQAPVGSRQLIQAEVRETLDFTPKIQGLEADHITDEFIDEVGVMIGIWGALEQQMSMLMTRVYPVRYANGRRFRGFGGTYGTRSQDVANHFGQIYATSDTAYGFAQGLVSSIANWKLYTMGLGTLSWTDRLFIHPEEELVETPTRQEMKPFGVTMHAMYALMHVLEFDLRLAGMMNNDDEWMQHAKHSIIQQQERIIRALATSQTAFHPTEDGEAFLDGVQDWARRLITRADSWK
jgi:hypothetical protein